MRYGCSTLDVVPVTTDLIDNIIALVVHILQELARFDAFLFSVAIHRIRQYPVNTG